MIVEATADAVRHAAELIRRGEIVAFPTETVYGLGADATNALAVSRVFERKERPSFDPLIVHIAERDWLGTVAREVPPAARALIDRFWPGPLTVVLRKTERIPDIVTAGLPSVGVRMPRHDVALALLKEAGVPIAAPSANRFGCVSPTTACHVADQLGEDLFILDGGPSAVGIESTVVSFLDQTPELLRPGAVTLEEIESIAGTVAVAGSGREGIAPGRSIRHYAPRIPLSLIDSPADVPVEQRRHAALLLFAPLADAAGFARTEVLSATGDPHEAAANLFAALHRLDASDCDRIYAARVSEQGLGRAIMDRLRRAAAAG
jgi:L-threonylcarbamoyladenylate synthase